MKININKMAGTIFYSMLKAKDESDARSAYAGIQFWRECRNQQIAIDAERRYIDEAYDDFDRPSYHNLNKIPRCTCYDEQNKSHHLSLLQVVALAGNIPALQFLIRWAYDKTGDVNLGMSRDGAKFLLAEVENIDILNILIHRVPIVKAELPNVLLKIVSENKPDVLKRLTECKEVKTKSIYQEYVDIAKAVDEEKQKGPLVESIEMKELCNAINQIRVYSENKSGEKDKVLRKLADDLTAKCDKFIKETDNLKIDFPKDNSHIKKHYYEFASECADLIQDNHLQKVINTKSINWETIVKNVLFGIATVGIAVGAFLLYTKKYEDHMRFPFSAKKTTSREKTDQVMESLTNIMRRK